MSVFLNHPPKDSGHITFFYFVNQKSELIVQSLPRTNAQIEKEFTCKPGSRKELSQHSSRMLLRRGVLMIVMSKNNIQPNPNNMFCWHRPSVPALKCCEHVIRHVCTNLRAGSITTMCTSLPVSLMVKLASTGKCYTGWHRQCKMVAGGGGSVEAGRDVSGQNSGKSSPGRE